MHFYNNFTISDRLFGKSLLAKLSCTLLGVFLLTASAKVSIPFFPVPMTLQTFVIYFLAASSGMLGFYSALLYVTLGLVGLPIFAAGGGIGYVFSPTFGFLYGMVIASFFISYMAINYFQNNNIFKILLSISMGAIIIFGCGILHLSIFVGISKAITLGLMPFVYSEILKIALAIFLTYALLKKTKQIN